MSIKRNAAAAVLQLVASTVIMFVLYRSILKILGVESLGIWSVVLATVSVSRLTEFGLSASITRFVAKYRGEGQDEHASHIIQTAVISLFVMLAVILPIVYLLLYTLFPFLFTGHALDDAYKLLPYALLSLFLTVTAGAFQSGLQGCQRYDLLAMLVIGGQFIFLIAALTLAPRFGLIGLAWAQIGQGCILLIVGWLLLRRAIPSLPYIPRKWRKVQFREMLNYGFQFQIGIMAMMLFDPLTKAMLGRYGGMSATGYYEMANQFVCKSRALIVSANQVLVPVVANNIVLDTKRFSSLYQTNLRLLWFVALPLYTLVLAGAPLLSVLWIGRYESQFVFFSSMLVFAWGMNTLSLPAYFSNLGSGHILWNTLSHIWTGVGNALLAIFLGTFFGAEGVVWGMVMALVSGSAIIVIEFHRNNSMPWLTLFPSEAKWLTLATITAFITFYFSLNKVVHLNNFFVYLTCAVLPLTIIFPALWKHPIRSAAQKLFFEFIRGGGSA